MLKLEKVSRTLEVSITLRKKEPLFSKNLVFALFFATALHLAAGLLFNIRTFLFTGSQSLIPPVIMDAVLLPPSDATVQIKLDEELTPRSIREPKKSDPALPDWPHHQLPIAKHHEELLWQKNPFEKQEFLPALDLPPPKKGVNIHFSGPIAQAALLHSPPPPKFTFQGRFHVRMEGSSGTLFWFESQQNNPHDHAIEKWLKEFRFRPDPNTFVEAGEVEVEIG